MAGGRLWTPEEIERVRRMGPHETHALARELGRSESAVRTKRFMLGLADATLWTEEEIAEVDRRIAAGETIPVVARAVGRTMKAIIQLRRRLRDEGVPVADARIRPGRGYRGRRTIKPAKPEARARARPKPHGPQIAGIARRGPAPEPSNDDRRRGEARRRIEARQEAERLAAELEW